jgi:hypothetical protein
MKRKIFLLLFTTSIIVGAILNLRINTQRELSSTITINTREALSTENDGSPNGQNLSGGCKTDYTSTYTSATKIRTITYSCAPGSEKQCKYGTKTYNNGVLQAGSSVTTYTCKS